MSTLDSVIPHTSIRRVEADGVTVFYREAGPADAPVVLLLHGFPTSSFQYRDLIPRLADRYRSASRRSFRKMGMLTRKDWDQLGLPLGVTGVNHRWKIVKQFGRF
jgi:pimeloyl-ACP methyl ester carboxylesterase